MISVDNNPLVSVVIASYNHEKYVQDTINSVINQTYENIELIILDDGSSDNTWQKILEIKEKCERRFVRIVFERQENAGANLAWNKANSYANGEFLLGIASDDLLKSIAIEKQVEFLINNPEYGLCVGDNEIIDMNGQRCYWDRKRNCIYNKMFAKYKTFAQYLQAHRAMDFKSKEFGTYETLYTGNYVPNGYLTRQSVNKKLHKTNDVVLLDDWFYMLQFSKYSKMKYIDEILFSYRWHNTNSIKNSDRMRELFRKTKDYEEKLLNEISQKDLIIDIEKIKKDGAFYKKQGVPQLFEILSYIKGQKKRRIIKLFGVKLFSFGSN